MQPLTDEEKWAHYLRPLTADEETLVRELHANDSVSDPRKIHPTDQTKFMNITYGNIARLKPNGWVNEEVINFMMYLIEDRAKRRGQPVSYFAQTFFMSKLVPTLKQYEFAQVRRLFRPNRLQTVYGIDNLFQFSKMFIPIHVNGNHWTLSVVDFTKKTIQYYDSLGKSGKAWMKHILHFLKDASATLDHHLDETDWSMADVTNAPMQTNGNDCGVFTIINAMCISDNIPLHYDHRHIIHLRKRFTLDIMKKTLDYQ